MEKRITSALISVYHKEGLDSILAELKKLGISIISTGGTWEYLNEKGYQAVKVEDITSYPSILGGRVKTLHPKIFGGILCRRDLPSDARDMDEYGIPPVDLVMVDLYPFEETLQHTDDETEIIEKIDIGGISLIRAAAKNYDDVLVVASREMYGGLLQILQEKKGVTAIEDRRSFATHAFAVSSGYDAAIFNYFNRNEKLMLFRETHNVARVMRYGENPHQQGIFFGEPGEVFNQLHGKELSYNNLVDLDAAISLVAEFSDPTFVVIKHTNACGLASRPVLRDAWKDALAGDPVSAFGGVIITNRQVDAETASEINNLFFEIIAAPSYENNALQLLATKKNRVILELKSFNFPVRQYKSVLNGVLQQDRDSLTETPDRLQLVTPGSPDDRELEDLLFAARIVKHTKSNAIVLAKNKQLIGSGTGQTSRVDALKQAIAKAREFNFDLQGAVMASDAFFPFADSVGLAFEAGIRAVIQPGGSVRDQESIDFCSNNGMSMVFSGTRHFKH